jgi:hypothetical protein
MKGVLWGLGALALAALTLRGSSKPPGPAPEPTKGMSAFTDRDVEALARMLHSETSHKGAQAVIGWMILTAAKSRKKSVFEVLTGSSGKYGHRVDHGESRIASTFKPPTADTLALARQLLSGEVQPAKMIRDRGYSAFVERGQEGIDAKKLLDRQTKPEGKGFGGIFARIQGSNWYLLNRKAPPVPYEDVPGGPERALATVPEVPALDQLVA